MTIILDDCLLEVCDTPTREAKTIPKAPQLRGTRTVPTRLNSLLVRSATQRKAPRACSTSSEGDVTNGGICISLGKCQVRLSVCHAVGLLKFKTQLSCPHLGIKSKIQHSRVYIRKPRTNSFAGLLPFSFNHSKFSSSASARTCTLNDCLYHRPQNYGHGLAGPLSASTTALHSRDLI